MSSLEFDDGQSDIDILDELESSTQPPPVADADAAQVTHIDPYSPISISTVGPECMTETLSAAALAAINDSNIVQLGFHGVGGSCLKEIQRELDLYMKRFEKSRASFQEKATQDLARLSVEGDFLRDHCQKELVALDEQLVARSNAPTSTVQRTDIARPSNRQSRVAEVSGRVVQYWKSKCGVVQQTIDAQKADIAILQGQLDDLRHVCAGDQHKTLRMIGLLREKLFTEVMRGNGYRELYQQLTTSAPGAKTVDKAERSNVAARLETPTFSPIEKLVVDREMDAFVKISTAHDKLIGALKHSNHIRHQFVDDLHNKVTTLQQRIATAGNLAFDKTLEEALDLRSRLSSLSGAINDAQVEALSSVREQHDRDEMLQSQSAADARNRHAESAAAEEREVRERKVSVIRMLCDAGDADSRYHRIRAQQSLSLLTSDIAAAENDRLRMKMELAKLSSHVRSNVSFLEK